MFQAQRSNQLSYLGKVSQISILIQGLLLENFKLLGHTREKTVCFVGGCRMLFLLLWEPMSKSFHFNCKKKNKKKMKHGQLMADS